MNLNEEWGEIESLLVPLLRLRNMQVGELAVRANVRSAQLKPYLSSIVKRPDLSVLARICAVLNCDVGDVLRYRPARESGGARAIQATYRTGQLAKEASLHPNSIRFYENAGLLSRCDRDNRGYRIFTYRHIVQLRVLRIIFSAQSSGKLRKQAFRILDSLREWDLPEARRRAQAYIVSIGTEYASAVETAAILKTWGEQNAPAAAQVRYSRTQAAQRIGTTPEAIRNWERNGLIDVPRTGANNTRVYGSAQMMRLKVIYLLRQNNFSMAAIHRALLALDGGDASGALLMLNQPDGEEDGQYENAGDRWLGALVALAEGAREILKIIEGVEEPAP